MNCPVCFDQLIHSDTKEVDEDVYCEEYACPACRVCVQRYYGDKVEDFI